MPVREKWLPEIADHCLGVKVVLCALKCDLRASLPSSTGDGRGEKAGSGAITYEEGLEVAKLIRARCVVSASRLSR